MRKFILLFALAGCAAPAPPPATPVEVDVPVPCAAPAVTPPVFPAFDAQADLFVKVRALLRELELRKGYESALLAARNGCAG